jgi:hypothetical protein
MTDWTFKLFNLDTQAYVGDLVDWNKVTAGFEFSAVSSFSCDYPLTGRFATLLDTDVEIVGFYNGAEPRNARWVSRGLDGNTIDDLGGKVSISALSWWDVLRKVVVYTSTSFTAQTPGAIIKTLFQTATTRGAFGTSASTTSTFTNTLDSNGNAWAFNLTKTYSPGDNYRAVLENLVALGLVDIEWQGRDLRVYNAGAMGTVKSVVLAAGRHTTENPFQKSTEDRANVVLIEGESNVLVERTTSGPRREESYMQQSGISNVATLNVVGDNVLAGLSVIKTQKVVKIPAQNTVEPFQDFIVGDWVLYDDGVNTVSSNRVKQLALEIDQDGNDVYSAALNDLILENNIKRALQLQSLAGGVGSTTIGVPASPSPPDTTIPSAPASCTVTSSTYVEGQTGQIRAQVTVGWSPVTTNTDTTAIGDLQRYEVQYFTSSSPLLPPSQWSTATIVDSSTTVAYFGPFEPGSSVTARVRAVDTAGHPSAWTTSSATTVVSDTTGPIAPSTPTVVTQFRGIQVTWNGLDNVGAVMSPDFYRCDLHVSTTTGFTPTTGTKVDSVTTRGAVFSVQGLTYGTTYYAKLVAYDTTGNASTPSAQGSATPQTLVSPDVPGLFITNAMIANLAVDDAKIASLSAGKITVGTLVADVTISARIKTANTGARIELNTIGVQGFDSGNNNTITLAAADGSALITGTYQTGLTGARIYLDPGGGQPTWYYYPTTTSNFAFINSPTGATTAATLGLNSGIWNSTRGGTFPVRSRLWLHDSGVQMQVNRVSDQATYGPSILMDQTYLTAEVKYGTSERSKILLGDSQVWIESWDSATSNPSAQLYMDNGSIQWGVSTTGSGINFFQKISGDAQGTFIGDYSFPNFITQGSNSGIVLSGSLLDNTSVQAYSFSYGVTATTSPIPFFLLALAGTTVPSFKIQSYSTTGFTLFKSSATAARYLFWCYRPNS